MPAVPRTNVDGVRSYRPLAFHTVAFWEWLGALKRAPTASDARRLKALELENSRLKRLLADALLENEAAKEALRKKW
mgnify:CR=1 FL=1